MQLALRHIFDANGRLIWTLLQDLLASLVNIIAFLVGREV